MVPAGSVFDISVSGASLAGVVSASISSLSLAVSRAFSSEADASLSAKVSPLARDEGVLVETDSVHSIAGPPRPVAHPEKVFRLNLPTYTQAISIELLHGNEN